MRMDVRSGRIEFEDGDAVRIADGGRVEASFAAMDDALDGGDRDARCAKCHFADCADACPLSRFCLRTYFLCYFKRENSHEKD